MSSGSKKRKEPIEKEEFNEEWDDDAEKALLGI